MKFDLLTERALEAFPNFVIVDDKGIVTYLNRVYAELLGVSQEWALGRPVTEVIPNTRMDLVVRHGKAEIGSVMELYDHRRGENIIVICNRIPIWDDEGKIVGAVAVTTASDLSEMNHLKVELARVMQENKYFKDTLAAVKQSRTPLQNIIGCSPEMVKIKRTIEDFAKSNLTTLITGETGVGKELFANAIHEMSTRSMNNYIKLNCAAIPKELLESELFGYVEGAFTGASRKGKIGKFELADNGTLLLDEIGEMPLALQAKLLRVLQEKEVERVGGLSPVKINVRIICTTNRNLEQMVREGKFREDLYYRINTVELFIPPLRDRIDDLEELCSFFLKKIKQEYNLNTTGFSQETYRVFKQYSWPGNIRELEHVIERLAVVNPSGVIGIESCDFLLNRIRNNNLQEVAFDCLTLQAKRDQAEREVILDALRKTGGNKTKAAVLLNIDRSMLYIKIKKLGM
jgi:PAS domain S-box-containing protein